MSSNKQKRHAVFSNIRNTVDVTILTETKFKHEDLDEYRCEWNSAMYSSCTAEDRAQSGVSILLRRGLDMEVSEEEGVGHGKDKNGRVVWILGKIRSKTILIIGVYGPPQGDDEMFFNDELFPILKNKTYDHVIMGGDFNVGMERQDYKGYADPSRVRPKSRAALHENIEATDLVDVYRVLNSDGKDFTWRSRASINSNTGVASQMSRIDFFLVDSNMAALVQTVGPCEPWSTSYDHKAVSMRIDLDKVTYGTSFWKFNNSFLEDLGFLQKVDDQIAWLVYTNQKAKPDGQSLSLRDISLLTKRERSNVELEVNPHAFMESLLDSIKRTARQHGRTKKKSQMTAKRDLEYQLEQANNTEKVLLRRMETEEWTIELYAELVEHQQETASIRAKLQAVDEHINEGAYIRTGFEWKCESEAPTGIFLKQEQWRGDQRYIGVLELEGGPNRAPRTIRTQPEIEQALVDYYDALYRERPTRSSTESIKEYLGEGYEQLENLYTRKTLRSTQLELDSEIKEEEVIHAINQGKAGRAPGMTGFTKEFYRFFSEDLIGFIMAYIRHTERMGILSDNQRLGVITLLPKGDKEKKLLKNWRPITLLPTLYKIVSTVINNRFRKVLPDLIHQDQKGFVDGRYMGEVTRQLYETIEDAHTYDKKGLIVGVDFEKAFDSLSHDFIKEVLKIMGFDGKLIKWVDILLNSYRSKINHAGNLLRDILLGRGARQGDPIATTMFVLAIEVLLIRIRTDKGIKPYSFFAGMGQSPIQSKGSAYADDVNITIPRVESSLRSLIKAIDEFAPVSGLKVNHEKTQVLRLGRSAKRDPPLCPDLKLTYVDRLKVLGVTFAHEPKLMEENFDKKILEIKKLINRWSFRNLTVYGRVELVKSLALSKLTHIVQVIPNPNKDKLLNLQRLLSNFIWSGKHCKKAVVDRETAMKPHAQGGMNVPHVEKFWAALKATWVHRLLQADEGQIWAQLCLQKVSRALGKYAISIDTLLETGPQKISQKCRNNQFWSTAFTAIADVNLEFYKKRINVTGELPLYENSCFKENGSPLDKTSFAGTITSKFKLCKDLHNAENNSLWHESDPEVMNMTPRERGDLQRLTRSVHDYLRDNDATWKDVTIDLAGPHHIGWSRLATTGSKSRLYYDLLRENSSEGRNISERDWANYGITFPTNDTWDKIYKLHGRTRTNYRIKFEEFRIIKCRQELRKNRELYFLEGGDADPKCSYCSQHKETEHHIYTQCIVTQHFWDDAAKWFRANIDDRLPKVLQEKPKLFGYWNEKPADNCNIFLRAARYTIFKGRAGKTVYDLKTFKAVLLDEYSYKYKGSKWRKYENDVNEMRPLTFYRRERGLSHINPKWLPPLQ